jgi:hypothetical protein
LPLQLISFVGREAELVDARFERVHALAGALEHANERMSQLVLVGAVGTLALAIVVLAMTATNVERLASIEAIQFAVGVFVLDQLAALRLSDILLLRWPELLERAWPLAHSGRRHVYGGVSSAAGHACPAPAGTRNESLEGDRSGGAAIRGPRTGFRGCRLVNP